MPPSFRIVFSKQFSCLFNLLERFYILKIFINTTTALISTIHIL